MSARPEAAALTVDEIVEMLDAVTTRAECTAAIHSIRTTGFTDEERAAISRAICRASGRALKS
jgi:hypothetical protein